jgi:hypothetical protein
MIDSDATKIDRTTDPLRHVRRSCAVSNLESDRSSGKLSSAAATHVESLRIAARGASFRIVLFDTRRLAAGWFIAVDALGRCESRLQITIHLTVRHSAHRNV